MKWALASAVSSSGQQTDNETLTKFEIMATNSVSSIIGEWRTDESGFRREHAHLAMPKAGVSSSVERASGFATILILAVRMERQ